VSTLLLCVASGLVGKFPNLYDEIKALDKNNDGEHAAQNYSWCIDALQGNCQIAFPIACMRSHQRTVGAATEFGHVLACTYWLPCWIWLCDAVKYCSPRCCCFYSPGQVDIDELAAAVETLAQKRSTIRNLRILVALLVSC
jgi:hypothetical protein